jgi:hypothetical protein
MRDRFLEEIRMGQSRRGAAETLGIPRTTINNLIGKDPKFTAALAEAEKARSDGKFGRTGRPVGAVSAFTEPVRKKFLEAVRMGMSITRAADLCRIDKQSVRRYRKADPVFRQDLLAAYAECEMPNAGGQEAFMDDYDHRFCALAGGWYAGKTWAGARKTANLHSTTRSTTTGEPTGVNSLIVGQDYSLATTINVPEMRDGVR